MTIRTTRTLLLTALCALVLALGACGGGGDDATQADKAADTPAVAATHDCDGACGMTAVPEAQLTQVDGKWYCAGCVEKAKAEHEGHDHG